MLPSHEVLGVLTRNGDALLSETGGRYFRHLSATLPVQEKAFSTHAVPDWSGCLFTVRAICTSKCLQPLFKDQGGTTEM